MAIRARLIPPVTLREESPWHDPSWSVTSVTALLRGERRMEAHSYLSSGYGLRLAMEKQSHPLRSYARVSQPSRLRGIQVSPEFGIPYLAATQVFDLRPTPRKWLALEKTHDVEQRLLRDGTILVTRSGSIGDVTIAHSPHLGVIGSDDLLRIEVKDLTLRGWMYAFLRSQQARAMMTSVQYGHVIKHLERSHLERIPFPVLSPHLCLQFDERVRAIFMKRDRAHELVKEAERLFSDSLGIGDPPEDVQQGFMIPASSLAIQRRRFEGSFHNPYVRWLLKRFESLGQSTEQLGLVADRVWWIPRFKRVFGDAGSPYLSAEDLFSLNPPTKKRVHADQAENPEDFFVKAGWLVMACSGQVYGMNGSVALMTKRHETAFLSHDLIRIIPKKNCISSGYLLIALGHPTLGRPLVLRYAYGTSIPHLEPTDVELVPIVRLGEDIENAIAERAERAVTLRSEADDLEDSITAEAQRLLERLQVGDVSSFAGNGETP